MSAMAAPQVARAPSRAAKATAPQGLPQRKCACGASKSPLSSLCDDCRARPLQRRLAVGASNDPLEREADRVADQVLVAPARSASAAVPPRIQRLGWQASGATATAPASVEAVLAASGRPLETALRRDMEQRFGHDFSRVRVHTDAAAAESARDVNAHAYTVGHHLVFGAGRFAPATRGGRHLLAHELTHVVQQTGAGQLRRRAATKALEPGQGDEEMTRRKEELAGGGGTPVLQRDLALEPPRPDAEGRQLNEAEIQAAIAFNQRVVAVIGASGISELRDVLGIAPEPAVIDAEFVGAVVRWQAVQGVSQDGRLGPRTARALFREIGAEGVGRGELVSGPTYRATTSLSPPVVGGRQDAAFRFEAEFADDPANGLYASCCEVRQFIQWDAAYAAAGPGGPPHGGFPAATPAGGWIEDRDTADTRYGHRTGPHSALGRGDEYIDNTGQRNAAFGHLYRGRDHPGSVRNAGHWRFMVRAYDVCNGNRRLGDDFLRITW